jgi:DNA-binding NarL/FixJ family response regulator
MVLDLRMPILSGLDVLKRVKHSHSKTHVIILTMYGSEPYVLEALRIGAEGFVVKDSVPSEIVKAIQDVSNGKRYLSPSLSEFVINAYIRKSREIARDHLENLTPREREVFQHAAEGMTNAEIASHLSISPRTVEVHRLNLMRKLGLHNQSELIRYAINKGFTVIEAPTSQDLG